MGKYYYASPQFPFTKVFPLGVVLVIVGVIAGVLGVADVIYTALKFVGNACEPTTYVSKWECPILPCNSMSLSWALASPGIWTGFFIMIGGAISTSLMYASSSSIKAKRDAAGVMVGLVGFPIGPVALVIYALRLFYMNGTFFCLNQGVIKITDYLEFLMPILQAVVIFLGWCICIAVLVALCRKGALTQRDQLEYDYSRRYREDYNDPRQQRPYVYASQESLVPPPMVWSPRDRSAGYQNPYMYARSEPQYAMYPAQAPAPASARQNYPYLQYPRQGTPRSWYAVDSYNRY